MGFADAFGAEDRTQIKFSDLYNLIESESMNKVKTRLLENAVRCEVPYEHIRSMLTGEKDPLKSYKETGLSPEGITALQQEYDEKDCELIDLKKRHEEQCRQLDEAQKGMEAKVKALKEYEDTGLTPDQIVENEALYAKKCKELLDAEKEISQLKGELGRAVREQEELRNRLSTG